LDGVGQRPQSLVRTSPTAWVRWKIEHRHLLRARGKGLCRTAILGSLLSASDDVVRRNSKISGSLRLRYRALQQSRKSPALSFSEHEAELVPRCHSAGAPSRGSI